MCPYPERENRLKSERGFAELKKLQDAARRKPLEMSRIQQKLEKLLAATVNKLESEWPPKFAHISPAQYFFRITVNHARHIYNAVCFLFADKTLKEVGWKWGYVFVLPPINRTILDSIFNAVFMLENLEERWPWYCQSGWREEKEKLERCKTAYPGLSGWDTWVDLFSEVVQHEIAVLGISEEKVANPKLIKWWPNPGKMLSQEHKKFLSPPNRRFLQHLNDWFYKEYSSQAHLGFHGLMTIGAGVLYNTLDREKREQMERDTLPAFRGREVTRTVTLLLCLLSEIDHYFKLGLEYRILELWLIVNEHTPEIKEIYELRYRDFWPHVLINGS